VNKNLKKGLKKYIRLGWYVDRETTHLIWKHSKGGMVVTAKTPSDHRAIKNMCKHFEKEMRNKW